MSILKCKDIKVTYILKKKEFIDGLDGLSINFLSGGINVIFGENGCGKTTLFNAISGLLPYDGKIFFDDVDAETMLIKDRHISYVRQELSLFPNKTIFDNLAFPLKTQKLTPEVITEKIYSVLKLFGISHLMNCVPSQISIGQVQKVSIAKALIVEPKVLILDEAFSNLDPAITKTIQPVIKQYAIDHDAIVLYVTHNIEDALSFGDYFKVINKQYVLYEGNKEDTNEAVLKQFVLGDVQKE